ncbi:MAG TPA: hypothetical protein VM639_03220 [Dongiaceae bacterium]|nr:hypothetical protein [Dongiaceae bacterium]
MMEMPLEPSLWLKVNQEHVHISTIPQALYWYRSVHAIRKADHDWSVLQALELAEVTRDARQAAAASQAFAALIQLAGCRHIPAEVVPIRRPGNDATVSRYR